MTRSKIATFTLKRDALMYDISNIAYVEGDIMPADSENAKHHTVDIAEDGNVDFVTRKMELAYAECVEALYPYSKEVAKDFTTKDNDLEETEVYTINLKVDEDFSDTTINYISKLAHEYIVNRVLSEWLQITNPASADKYILKCEDIKTQMRVRLNAYCGRVRRRQTPF